MSRLDKDHFPHDVYKYYLEDRYLQRTLMRSTDVLLAQVEADQPGLYAPLSLPLSFYKTEDNRVVPNYGHFTLDQLAMFSCLVQDLVPREERLANPDLTYVDIRPGYLCLQPNKTKDFICRLDLAHRTMNKIGNFNMLHAEKMDYSQTNFHGTFLLFKSIHHTQVTTWQLGQPPEIFDLPPSAGFIYYVTLGDDNRIYYLRYNRSPFQATIVSLDLTGKIVREIECQTHPPSNHVGKNLAVNSRGEIVYIGHDGSYLCVLDSQGQLSRTIPLGEKTKYTTIITLDEDNRIYLSSNYEVQVIG